MIAKGGHLYITLEPKTMSFPAMKTIHLIVQKQFTPFTLHYAILIHLVNGMKKVGQTFFQL